VAAADFEAFRDQLRAGGFRETEARNDEAAFGSWVIALDTDPLHRVVWDGKERWLIVQVQHANEWTNERVIRDERDQTAEAVVASLDSLKGHS
jgi:hypothetical protein